MQKHTTTPASAGASNTTKLAQVQPAAVGAAKRILTDAATPPQPTGFIDEREALRRVPVSRKTWNTWRNKGLIPFVRLPGSRRVIYSWPQVEAALLRMSRGGTQ